MWQPMLCVKETEGKVAPVAQETEQLLDVTNAEQGWSVYVLAYSRVVTHIYLL